MIRMLGDYFSCRDDVDFAYLFGSQARGKALPFSDVDIAVHFRKRPDIFDLGRMIVDLEEMVRADVDLVVLNDLERRDVALAFTIVSEGRLLFCREREAWSRFKHRVYLWYLDVLPLRELMRKLLLRRIREGSFGRVGTPGEIRG